VRSGATGGGGAYTIEVSQHSKTTCPKTKRRAAADPSGAAARFVRRLPHCMPGHATGVTSHAAVARGVVARVTLTRGRTLRPRSETMLSHITSTFVRPPRYLQAPPAPRL
jgi:hypothetical protein